MRVENIYAGAYDGLWGCDMSYRRVLPSPCMRPLRFLREALRTMPLSCAVVSVMVFLCYLFTLMYIVESLCPLAAGCIVLVLVIGICYVLLMMVTDEESDVDSDYDDV